LVFGANFPKHDDAEKVVARMAKYGINCIRLHSLDEFPSPRGLLQADLGTPDPDQFDKLDYLIAQLKRNGIYVDVVLHASRTYPGFPLWDGMPPFFKGIDIFYPPMVQAQHQYASMLLSHLNRYTGLTYKDDSVVAFVEINNEDGLMFEWWSGALDNMPDPYRGELQRQWNTWLRVKYRRMAALRRAWGGDTQVIAPTARADSWAENPASLVLRRTFVSRTLSVQRDWVRFLWDTERHFWNNMRSFLKVNLLAKSLIIGTQVSYSPSEIQADLDVLDDHAYWQHPSFEGSAWDPDNWTIKNLSMAGAADGGTIPRLALGRVIGKPYICSEYSHPAPNTYSSESLLLLAAYAGLQDWDGILAYDYSKRQDAWSQPGVTNFFDIDRHTTKMATLPVAGALFVRGDVQSTRVPTVACASLKDTLERVRTSGPRLRAGDLGLPLFTSLETAIGIAPCDTRPVTHDQPDARSPFHDRRDQLSWASDSGKGVVTIDTPRSKAVIGFVSTHPYVLGDVTITPGNTIQGWAAITVTVMEGNTFTTARRILVTATGYSQNIDALWTSTDRTSLGRHWGSGPMVVEGIPVSITLPYNSAGETTASSLDPSGHHQVTVPVEVIDGRRRVQLTADYHTIWYALEIRGRP